MVSPALATHDLPADVLASLPVALVTVDAHGGVRAWNDAAQELFGWSREEAVGSRLPLLNGGDGGLLAGIIQFAGTGSMQSVCIIASDRRGNRLPVQVKAAACESRPGDVTLAFHHAKWESSRFSHDAANHLSIIAGYAEILAYKLPADSEHQVGVTRIIEAAYALAKLVQR